VLSSAALARRHPRSLDPAVRLTRGLLTWRTIKRTLDSEWAQQVFGEGLPLPHGFGIGMTERVVEFPWLFVVLDAGSALNHKPILGRILPTVTALHIVTLGPEKRSFPERGVSYLYADVRELPYASEVFDDIVCLSTLEHVGMDNSHYVGAAPAPTHPGEALQDALRELLRVVRVGGRLLLTIPYGRPDDHGWLRVFARDDIEAIAAHGSRADVTVYGYGPEGWFLSDLEQSADAVYRVRADEPCPADLAGCARAVACINLTR
jgi:SAM-dependent methyltransferase